MGLTILNIIEETSNNLLTYAISIIGALSAVIVYLYIQKEKQTAAHNLEKNQLHKDYNMKAEKKSEEVVSILEKSLNAVSGFEKAVIDQNGGFLLSMQNIIAPLKASIDKFLLENKKD